MLSVSKMQIEVWFSQKYSSGQTRISSLSGFGPS